MDELKFDAYDIEKLKAARKTLVEVFNFNLGFPAHRRQLQRLETIVKKLDELIAYEAEKEPR